MENAQYVNTGLGFGAEKGSPILAEMMADYQVIPFVLPDGSYNPVTCPMMNKPTLVKHGFVSENKEQLLEDVIHIYPSEYFCPKSYETGKIKVTRNTFTIHHFNASWHTKYQNVLRQKKKIYIQRYGVEIGTKKYEQWERRHHYSLAVLRKGWKGCFKRLFEKICGED